MIYFDTSYIARLYLEDPGWERVRALAATDHVASCLHSKAETIAAFHRKFRENVLTRATLEILLKEFVADCDRGAFHWLPLSELVVNRLMVVYHSLPSTTHLRAADAIHLGCAAEKGFLKIYSNDLRLLEAAQHFGIDGVNII